MKIFNNIIQRIIRVVTAGAGGLLFGAMLVVVASVTSRFFNVAITGAMELMELMIGVTVAVALAYSALQKGHVAVKLIVSRFPIKTGAIIGIAVALLCLAIWGWMVYAAADITAEKGLREVSETLGLPYLPFRAAFMLGLALFSLTFVSDIYEEIRKASGKWSQ
jgi:TRAP-type C4-dicarboxylate transport system permease small subunit